MVSPLVKLPCFQKVPSRLLKSALLGSEQPEVAEAGSHFRFVANLARDLQGAFIQVPRLLGPLLFVGADGQVVESVAFAPSVSDLAAYFGTAAKQPVCLSVIG